MKIKKISILFNLLNALSISLGFTSNRSEWSMIPQLNLRTTTSVEVLMKDIPVKAINATMKTFETTKPLDHQNVTTTKIFQQKDSSKENLTLTTEEMVNIPKLRIPREKVAIETSAVVSNKIVDPLNVIFLLIDGLYNAEESLDPESSYLFPVQGFLQTCPRNHQIKYHNNCNCDESLRNSIVSLLSWSQNVKGMSTGTLYETSAKMSMDTRSYIKSQNRQIDREPSWHLNDPWKRRTFDSRKSRIRRHENPEDSAWHVSSILKRLRDTFFRTLMNSLNSVRYIDEDDAYKRQVSNTNLKRSNFRELTRRVLEDLESISHQKGYVLVISLNTEELADTLELLRRYVSVARTLTVITSSCPRDKSSYVPFFANGPASNRLINVKYLQELPNVIRTIIDETNCQDSTKECSIDSEKIDTQKYHMNFDDGPLVIYDDFDLSKFRVPRRDDKAIGQPDVTQKKTDFQAKPMKLVNEETPGYIGIRVFMQDDNE